MPLPARGTAAAAQAMRNQKQWQASLLLWQQALSRAPTVTTIVSAISRRWPMPARTARRSAKRVAVAEQASIAHLQTLSYVYLRLGKSWDQLLVDTQIFDREPQNKAALASLMATLTRNRIDSPPSASRITSN